MTLPTPYYQSERVTLYCGNALEVLPEIEYQFGAVVTDPPYGIGYSSGHGSTVWGDGAIEGDESTETRDKALEWWGIDTPALVFGSWKKPPPRNVRACLVWDTMGALGMGDLQIPWKPAHQQIYVCGSRHGFAGERSTDVLRFPPVQSMAKNGRVHPFEKPVDLMLELIGKCAGTDTILDPFMGSGTTCAVAKRLGRNGIGIDIRESQVELANRRIG